VDIRMLLLNDLVDLNHTEVLKLRD